MKHSNMKHVKLNNLFNGFFLDITVIDTDMTSEVQNKVVGYACEAYNRYNGDENELSLIAKYITDTLDEQYG